MFECIVMGTLGHIYLTYLGAHNHTQIYIYRWMDVTTILNTE